MHTQSGPQRRPAHTRHSLMHANTERCTLEDAQAWPTRCVNRSFFCVHPHDTLAKRWPSSSKPEQCPQTGKTLTRTAAELFISDRDTTVTKNCGGATSSQSIAPGAETETKDRSSTGAARCRPLREKFTLLQTTETLDVRVILSHGVTHSLAMVRVRPVLHHVPFFPWPLNVNTSTADDTTPSPTI